MNLIIDCEELPYGSTLIQVHIQDNDDVRPHCISLEDSKRIASALRGLRDEHRQQLFTAVSVQERGRISCLQRDHKNNPMPKEQLLALCDEPILSALGAVLESVSA